MQTNTDVFEQDVQNIQIDWGQFRVWAEKAFTKERIAGITLATVSGAVGGAIMLTMYKAMQASVYTGLGYTVFGGF